MEIAILHKTSPQRSLCLLQMLIQLIPGTSHDFCTDSAPFQPALQTSKDLAQNTNDRAHLHHSRGWPGRRASDTSSRKVLLHPDNKISLMIYCLLATPKPRRSKQRFFGRLSVQQTQNAPIFWGRVEEFT